MVFRERKIQRGTRGKIGKGEKKDKTLVFEVVAAVFSGKLGNVFLCELVEGFVEYRPERLRRRRRRRRRGVHGEYSGRRWH